MNDTTIPQNVDSLFIRKVKSGFIVEEKGAEGYQPISHACTDNVQVDLIVSTWTSQKNFN